MSVLDPERVAPRSALRYQPSRVNDQAQPGPRVARRSRVRVDTFASAAKAMPDHLDQEEREDQPSRRRPGPAAPQRRSPSKPPARKRRRVPLLLSVAGVLIALVLLWEGVSQALVWGNNVFNGLRYGYPRTFQVDAVVGHQDSKNQPSHFLAINLRGQIEIIEWPGGDASHARVYVVSQLVGPGSDLEPVTLRFLDLTGDHLPEMVITFQGMQTVLINDQGSFRQLRPEEQEPIMQRLRQLEHVP